MHSCRGSFGLDAEDEAFAGGFPFLAGILRCGGGRGEGGKGGSVSEEVDQINDEEACAVCLPFASATQRQGRCREYDLTSYYQVWQQV